MTQKFNIIYADPPWSYKDKCRAGERGAEYKYPCMKIEDIKTLPVKNFTADDAFLFLWVTMPFLQEGLDVIKSWGFEYKSVAFTWVKRNKKTDSWFWGMGNWTRANAELCLLGIKGKPQRVSKSVHSVIDTPIEEHSKKPDVARERIIELCGDLPRLEMFARNRVPGWSAWGNEIESDTEVVV